MCKIQRTTVLDETDEQARGYMQIADKLDPEPSDQHVVFSVLVSTEPVASDTRPVSFRILQTRALKEAIALLGRVEDERMPK